MTVATNVERRRGTEAKPIEDADIMDPGVYPDHQHPEPAARQGSKASQTSSNQNLDAASFVNSPDPHRDGQEDEDNTEYNV